MGDVSSSTSTCKRNDTDTVAAQRKQTSNQQRVSALNRNLHAARYDPYGRNGSNPYQRSYALGNGYVASSSPNTYGPNGSNVVHPSYQTRFNGRYNPYGPPANPYDSMPGIQKKFFFN